MIADLKGFQRLGHLTYAPLPGGEQAVRQPWRMAAAYLQMAYGQRAGQDQFLELDIPFVRQLDHTRWQLLRQMIVRGLNTPLTSSLGRLFDAVSALLGICSQTTTYEGQAAIELEAVAVPGEASYPFQLLESDGTHSTAWQMDPAPALRALVADLQQGLATATIAGRFHETVAQMLAAAVRRVVHETGLRQVALSGGVFQNRLLLERLLHLLQDDGLQTLINRKVPPNDGGLSLGQAAIAGALCRDP
jgi:hydrogenase maturation protein HypF